MTTDRLIEIMLALCTIFIGYRTFISASNTTRIESKAAIRAVDAGAFERAKQIYEGALDTLREELTACRTELVSTHKDLTSAHSDLNFARREISQLRNEISQLKDELHVLKRQVEQG